jgi:cytochrome c oxidase subunit 2
MFVTVVSAPAKAATTAWPARRRGVNKFQLFPDRASNFSSNLDALATFLTLSSVAITLVLCVLVAVFAIKYRRRSEDEVPPLLSEPHWFEWVMSAGLFAIFMVMFFWGTDLYVQMKRPVDNALTINVYGKQWMWKLQHPGGQQEINELHVPLGRPIKLNMISHDVIHSFGIPAFRVKQDVLPGSYTSQWFTPVQKGEFHLFCQEYCGTEHAEMIGRVVVMEPTEYQAWLAGVPIDETPVTAGAKLFGQYGCMQCHGQTAPTLAGLYGRKVTLEDGSTVVADDQYLRDSILNPPLQVVAGFGRLMPSYRGQLTEDQVLSLIAYIKTLGDAQSDSPAPAATGVAAPATRPVHDLVPRGVPNFPPAGEPPGVDRPTRAGDARP